MRGDLSPAPRDLRVVRIGGIGWDRLTPTHRRRVPCTHAHALAQVDAASGVERSIDRCARTHPRGWRLRLRRETPRAGAVGRYSYLTRLWRLSVCACPTRARRVEPVSPPRAPAGARHVASHTTCKDRCSSRLCLRQAGPYAAGACSATTTLPHPLPGWRALPLPPSVPPPRPSPPRAGTRALRARAAGPPRSQARPAQPPPSRRLAACAAVEKKRRAATARRSPRIRLAKPPKSARGGGRERIGFDIMTAQNCTPVGTSYVIPRSVLLQRPRPFFRATAADSRSRTPFRGSGISSARASGKLRAERRTPRARGAGARPFGVTTPNS